MHKIKLAVIRTIERKRKKEVEWMRGWLVNGVNWGRDVRHGTHVCWLDGVQRVSPTGNACMWNRWMDGRWRAWMRRWQKDHTIQRQVIVATWTTTPIAVATASCTKHVFNYTKKALALAETITQLSFLCSKRTLYLLFLLIASGCVYTQWLLPLTESLLTTKLSQTNRPQIYTNPHRYNW